MSLRFPSEWRFEGVDVEITAEAYAELHELVEKIASGAAYSKGVYEKFKSRFGMSSSSSNESWAASDMDSAMSSHMNNAALFIDAYWSAIQDIAEAGIDVPSQTAINKILRTHNIPFEIEPPHLRRVEQSYLSVNDSQQPPTTQNGLMRYKLGEQIGQGGFGQVFRATRTTDFADFLVAVKILNPSPFIEDKAKALARFKREVRALQTLQHRAIVPYLDAGLNPNGHPFLVMPFIEGISIRDAVPRADALVAVKMMIEVLDGLRFTHSKDVLHRDLKPSNILVRNSDHQPIIVDFGAAYLFENATEETLTTSSGLVGSLGYIPNEVVANPRHRSVTHDIYSCGVILYEVLAGRRPDPRSYQSLSQIKESLSVVDHVVQRALAPEQNRYQSANEFIEDLSELSRQRLS